MPFAVGKETFGQAERRGQETRAEHETSAERDESTLFVFRRSQKKSVRAVINKGRMLDEKIAAEHAAHQRFAILFSICIDRIHLPSDKMNLFHDTANREVFTGPALPF